MQPVTVLLVDDSPTFLGIVTRFLQEGDATRIVGSACSGEEAIALARDLQPQVVLLDLAMPGLHGLDTIPRLKNVAPSTGIVVLTLLDGKAYRLESLLRGAADLVAKSSMAAELVPTILRVAHAAPSPAERSTDGSESGSGGGALDQRLRAGTGP